MLEVPTTDTIAADKVVPDLLWVRNDNGCPQVRWRLVVGYLVLFTAVQLVSLIGVGWYAQTPVRWPVLVIMQCGMLASLLVAIELQYRALATGRWRFHLGLRTWFLATLLACVAAGAGGYELRALQQGETANERLTAQLQEVVGSGHVAVGRLDGTGVSVSATRADFSDADLARVMELASARTGRCELTMLVLEKTAVTSAGVAQLADCRQLTLLALPSLTLTTSALEAILNNNRLQFLTLDETRLTPGQLRRLREALPDVRLNGRTWQQRAAQQTRGAGG